MAITSSIHDNLSGYISVLQEGGGGILKAYTLFSNRNKVSKYSTAQIHRNLRIS